MCWGKKACTLIKNVWLACIWLCNKPLLCLDECYQKSTFNLISDRCQITTLRQPEPKVCCDLLLMSSSWCRISSIENKKWVWHEHLKAAQFCMCPLVNCPYVLEGSTGFDCRSMQSKILAIPWQHYQNIRVCAFRYCHYIITCCPRSSISPFSFACTWLTID